MTGDARLKLPRRALFGHLSAAALLAGPAGQTLAAAPKQPARLLSSADDQTGNSHLVAAGVERGDCQLLVDLPARGHAITRSPDGKIAVICARRPGRFAVAFDPRTGRELARFETPDNRHFYGHAAFHHGGRLLVATENNIETGRGVLGLYDATDGFRRVGEWDSGGIGPHELIPGAGQGDLLIANGGLDTRPETGRAKLNIETMQPGVTLMNGRDGSIARTLELPDALRWLSLRHLAVNGSGTMAVAGQWEGDAYETPPLVAVAGQGGGLRMLDVPDAVLARMNNYCGSTCFDSSGLAFAVSSPRGNLATFWTVEAPARYLCSLELPDVCGVVASGEPGGFYLSSGLGAVVHFDVRRRVVRRVVDPARAATVDPPVWRWDNHMLLVEEV